MPNYTINIGVCIGKRQSPICTGYSVTLVLACSATPVGRILDTKHWHCFYNPLFRPAISGIRSPPLSFSNYNGTRDEMGQFPSKKDNGVAQVDSTSGEQLPDYRFIRGEINSSSFLNSIMRSRIIAAFSNSRFLAAVFIWDSRCLIS